jgi:hypothetical protein
MTGTWEYLIAQYFVFGLALDIVVGLAALICKQNLDLEKSIQSFLFMLVGVAACVILNSLLGNGISAVGLFSSSALIFVAWAMGAILIATFKRTW